MHMLSPSLPVLSLILSYTCICTCMVVDSALPDIADPGLLPFNSSYGLQAHFFMYDHPVFDEFEHIFQCLRGKQQRLRYPESAGEVWAARLLRSHPRRTLDPSQASLFYVPIYAVLSLTVGTCRGKAHADRLTAVAHYLQGSEYFNRRQGADHIFTIVSLNASYALQPHVHQLLSENSLIAIMENTRLHNWGRWRCPEKVVTIPYTPHPALLHLANKLSIHSRGLDFFYAGLGYRKQERKNLKLLLNVTVNAFITLAPSRAKQLGDEAYVTHMTSAKFCPCPSGMTPSTRRLFDAVAAGCIPLVEEATVKWNQFPFPWKLRYQEFTVLVPEDVLLNPDKFMDWAAQLLQDFRSNPAKYARMQEKLYQVGPDLLYGAKSHDTEQIYSRVMDNVLAEAEQLLLSYPNDCCDRLQLHECCRKQDNQVEPLCGRQSLLSKGWLGTV